MLGEFKMNHPIPRHQRIITYLVDHPELIVYAGFKKDDEICCSFLEYEYTEGETLYNVEFDVTKTLLVTIYEFVQKDLQNVKSYSIDLNEERINAFQINMTLDAKKFLKSGGMF